MNLKEDIVPNKLELLLYAIVSAAIVFFGNFSYFTTELFGATVGSTESLGGMFRIFVRQLLEFLDNLAFTPATSVFLFWSIAGIIAFSLLQSIYGVYTEIKNDIDVTTHFLHPKNYKTMDFWHGVLVQFVAHVSLYIIVMMWLAILGFVLVPMALTTALAYFAHADKSGALTFVSAFVLLTIGVTVFGQLLKLLLKRKQFIT